VATPRIEPSGEQTLGTPVPLTVVRNCPLVASCTSITSPAGVARPCGGAKTIFEPPGLDAATDTPATRGNCIVLISTDDAAAPEQAFPGANVQLHDGIPLAAV